MKTLLLLILVLSIVSCSEKEINNVVNVQSNTKVKIKNKTSNANLIDCEKTCKNDPSIIMANDSGYSYLAFPNFGHWGIGRCRGHAITTQKFSILAHYTSGLGCNIKDKTCLNSLKQKVSKVLNNEFVEFKGFRCSLRSL